jgi:hypothetical protein
MPNLLCCHCDKPTGIFHEDEAVFCGNCDEGPLCDDCIDHIDYDLGSICIECSAEKTRGYYDGS